MSVPYSRYLIYPIPWYSFLIVLGASLAVFLAVKEEKRSGIKKDTVIDLVLIMLPVGIIGARIYYVVFSWPQFRDDFFSVFRIWEGGLAIYGGILAGLVVLILFCKKRGLPTLLLCDIIVPSLALAQSIGRWGNYFNMEAYGFTITDPRFCFFPFAVQIPADGYAWHLATFFYESLWDFSIFLFLVVFRRKYHKLKQGDLFFFYAFLYAAGRLAIEEMRLDSLYAVSSVRISQLLSVIICLLIIIYYLIKAKNSKIIMHSCLIWITASGLLLAFLLLFSLAPSLFIGFSRQHNVFSLLICSFLLVFFFFRFYLLYSCIRGVNYADNEN